MFWGMVRVLVSEHWTSDPHVTDFLNQDPIMKIIEENMPVHKVDGQQDDGTIETTMPDGTKRKSWL
jgi:hypothetical protein